MLYYISPTVWAWRPGRLKTIRRNVARMMLIFPFEEKIYAEAGIPARFIGHPLIERVRTEKGRDEVRAALGIEPGRPLVALLPGSRRGEVARHMPTLMAALPRIAAASGAHFVLIKAEDLDEDYLRSFIPDVRGRADHRRSIPLRRHRRLRLGPFGLRHGQPRGRPARRPPDRLLQGLAPDLCCSASSSIRIRRFSIVNILAGEPLVPELIQKDFTPDRLADAAFDCWASEDRRSRMKARFAEIRAGLGGQPASHNAARELADLLEQTRPPAASA